MLRCLLENLELTLKSNSSFVSRNGPKIAVFVEVCVEGWTDQQRVSLSKAAVLQSPVVRPCWGPECVFNSQILSC